MPILKVSSSLVKQAMEVIRINITILGDCPQCGGNDYRSGVCEDCSYIAPEVMEAIQEWNESQGVEQKAASARFSFADYFPSHATTDEECPKCGKRGFDLFCENPKCGYERPPRDLDHRSPEFTGISPDMEIRRKFVSPAGHKIKKHKKKLKNKKHHKKSSLDPAAAGLDDSEVVKSDGSTRIHQMQLTDADAKRRQNLQGQGQGPDEEEQE